MPITSTPIPTIMTDDYQVLVSSVNNDTLTWSTGTTIQSGYGNAIPGGGTGYTYTTNTTSPWIATGANINPAMAVSQGGSIEINGEDADIKINGKSMKAWMERVEQRLNILTPNPELEQDWDDLRRLGERYRKLEKKCQEKARMWQELKKIQPRQS